MYERRYQFFFYKFDLLMIKNSQIYLTKKKIIKTINIMLKTWCQTFYPKKKQKTWCQTFAESRSSHAQGKSFINYRLKRTYI